MTSGPGDCVRYVEALWKASDDAVGVPESAVVPSARTYTSTAPCTGATLMMRYATVVAVCVGSASVMIQSFSFTAAPTRALPTCTSV